MNEKKTIVLVDAVGGPHPSFYAPLLPEKYDFKIIILQPKNQTALRLRRAALESRFSVIEVSEKYRLKEVVREVSQECGASGILAFSERVVHDVSEVALELGLPANQRATQNALTDKYAQREMLEKAGVATPRLYRIKNKSDLVAAASYVNFPAVLKPQVGMGSLSVYRIENIDELTRSYDEAVGLYVEDERVSCDPIFLLEQAFIGEKWNADKRLGDYASVETIVNEDVLLHIGVTDKFPLVYPYRETGHIFPSQLSVKRIDQLVHEAEQGIKALGITNGVVHTEIKFTESGPRIIEINGRIGGSVCEMLYYSSDYNVIEQLCHVAVGESPTQAPSAPRQYSALYRVQPPTKKIKITKTPLKENLLKIDGVKNAEIVFQVGSEADWRVGSASNLVRIFSCAENSESLIRFCTNFDSSCGIEFEEIGE